MMTAHFTLTLDTAPPANPTIVVNAGASVTGDRVVSAVVASQSVDNTSMLIWGDLDPVLNANYQATEGASTWVPFTSPLVLRLSSGAARKYLYVRLRDDVLNVSAAATTWIDLDLTTPVVSIVVPVDRSRLSLQPFANTGVFSWSSSQAFTDYQVRLVPTPASLVTAGIAIGSAFGSINVLGSGAFGIATPIATTLTASDLRAASPGDGPRICKVFVRTSTGVWSV